MRNVVVKRIQQLQPFQIGHVVEVHYRLAIVLAYGELVLQAAHHVAHLGKLFEVVELT